MVFHVGFGGEGWLLKQFFKEDLYIFRQQEQDDQGNVIL